MPVASQPGSSEILADERAAVDDEFTRFWNDVPSRN
jgi:hypothetical protein